MATKRWQLLVAGSRLVSNRSSRVAAGAWRQSDGNGRHRRGQPNQPQLSHAIRFCVSVRNWEPWKAHAKGTASNLSAAIGRALVGLGLPQDQEFRHRYPSQISVEQAQRVLIAITVMHSPALLIADEPTGALDAVTQSEILQMFATRNREMGSAVLYISHDPQSVASISHRIAILQGGGIVECEVPETVLNRPQHTYTQRLLA